MDYTLGRVGIKPHATYDPNAVYQLLDMVPYQGASYIALGPAQGIPPTDAAYWVKVAEAGRNVELQKTATHVQWRVDGGEWVDLVALIDIKGNTGNTGATGAQGPAATVRVGTVTTLPPGADAKVTNSGTEGAAVLDFELPAGHDGAGTGDMLWSTWNARYQGSDSNTVGNADSARDAEKLGGQGPGYYATAAALAAKQPALIALTVTLQGGAANWPNNRQTVGAPGVSADAAQCVVWVGPAPESREAYNDAGIQAASQGEGTLTFECEDAPGANVTACIGIGKVVSA